VEEEVEEVKPMKLTDVVAEREYQLQAGDQEARRVRLRFGKPRPFPDGASYYCVFQIDGLDGGSKTKYSGGADSVQALQLAMQMALMVLVNTDSYRSGRLTWKGSHDLGLPVE
jgi:hypothetical protein